MENFGNVIAFFVVVVVIFRMSQFWGFFIYKLQM